MNESQHHILWSDRNKAVFVLDWMLGCSLSSLIRADDHWLVLVPLIQLLWSYHSLTSHHTHMKWPFMKDF